jgi:2-phospho-L-lactate guanylyltransferase
MKTAVLVPAKGFAKAKRRLAPVLSQWQRRALAESMFRRVLQRVGWARGVDATFVVTRDGEVEGLAHSLGAQVISEHEERGESYAVSFALGELVQRGFRAVLVLPGDLPLLHSVDVETVLNQLPTGTPDSPFALLVPSWDRMGTNALLLSPPHVIHPRFGYDSLCTHLAQIASKGVPFKIVENRRIALDIDEPNDLKHVRQSAIDGGRCCGQILTNI